MSTINNNALTDRDRETVAGYLRDYGYASLDEWALDSDYYQDEVSTEWHGLCDGPFASPVDIELACFRYIELQGELQDERRYGFS